MKKENNIKKRVASLAAAAMMMGNTGAALSEDIATDTDLNIDTAIVNEVIDEPEEVQEPVLAAGFMGGTISGNFDITGGVVQSDDNNDSLDDENTNFVINKKQVKIPSGKTYDVETCTFDEILDYDDLIEDLGNFDYSIMDYDHDSTLLEGCNQTVRVRIFLLDPNNYEFTNGESEAYIDFKFVENLKDTLLEFNPTITTYSGTYDEKSHDLVTVSNIPDGATIKYIYDGKEYTNGIEMTDSGSYDVKVVIECEGYETYETTVTAVINKVVISLPIEIDVDCTKYSGQKKVEGNELLGDYYSKILNVAKNVKIREDSDVHAMAEIKPGLINNYIFSDGDTESIITFKFYTGLDLNVQVYNETYDGFEHNLVTISNLPEDSFVEYYVNGEYSDGTATDAGTYEVRIIVEYISNHKIVELEKTVTATINKAKLTIISADETLEFTGSPLKGSKYEANGLMGAENVEVTFTGSYTEAGEYKNSFEYTLIDGAKASNYDVECVYGTLTINQSVKSIENLNISFENGNNTISADEDVNALLDRVVVKDGDKVLVKGVDYTVEFADDQNALVNRIVIKGIGNYEGSVYKNYESEKEITANIVGNIIPADGKQHEILSVCEVSTGTKVYINGGPSYIPINGKTKLSFGTTGGRYETDLRLVKPGYKITEYPITVIIYEDILEIPTCINSEEYTGSLINFVEGFDSETMEIVSGTLSATEAGNYTVKIKTKDKYVFSDLTQTKEFTYTINPISLTNANITLNNEVLGSKEDPNVMLDRVVVKVGDKELVKGVDYTVALNDEKNAVVVTCIGNYTGSLTKEFIVNKVMEVTVSPVNITYDGSEHELAIITNAPEGSIIEYIVDEKSSLEGSSKNAGTYKVKVRITCNGYETYETTVDSVINKRNLQLISTASSKVYDGKPLINNVVNKVNLAEGDNVNIVFTGNQTNVGATFNTFTYEFEDETMANNYNVTCTYGILEVKSYDLNDSDVTLSNNVLGSEEDPNVLLDRLEVKVGDKVLVKDVDYRVQILVSNKCVVVVGQGNYSGVVSKRITVNKKMNPEVNGYTGTYDGENHNLVTITNIPVKTNITYTVNGVVTDGTAIDAGTYEVKVTIECKGYDTYETTINSVINRKKISMPTGKTTTYNRVEQELVEGFDSNTMTVSGGILRINAGNYSFVIKSKDNYEFEDGSLTTTVNSTINKRVVILTSESLNKSYDGKGLSNNTVTVSGDGWVVNAVNPHNGMTASDNISYEFGLAPVNAGVYENTFTIKTTENINRINDNYDITYNYGTLTISPKILELTSISATKIYDEKPLMANIVSINGLVEGESINTNCTASITEVGSTENTFTYEFTNGTLASNYAVTCNFGTLTIEPKKIMEPIVNGYNGTYDGGNHDLFIIGNMPENSVFSYSLDGGNTFTNGMLNTKDCGEYNIVVRIECKDYEVYETTVNAVINHKVMEPVIENKVNPTYYRDGHYDLVVYCESGEELSRETITINRLKRVRNVYEEDLTTRLDYDYENSIKLNFINFANFNKGVVGYIVQRENGFKMPVYKDLDREDSLTMDINADPEFDDEMTIINNDNDNYIEAFDNYIDSEYYNEHPYFIYYTKGYGTYVMEVCSTYVISEDHVIPVGMFDSEELFNEYKEYVTENAVYNTGIEYNYGDRLVSLVTYNDQGEKIILLCKLTEIKDTNSYTYRYIK